MQNTDVDNIFSEIYNITRLLEIRHKKIKVITSEDNQDIYNLALNKISENYIDPNYNHNVEFLVNHHRKTTKNIRGILYEYNTKLYNKYKNNSDILFKLIKNMYILPKSFFNNTSNYTNEDILENFNHQTKANITRDARREYSRLVSHLPNYEKHIAEIFVYWIQTP